MCNQKKKVDTQKKKQKKNCKLKTEMSEIKDSKTGIKIKSKALFYR